MTVLNVSKNEDVTIFELLIKRLDASMAIPFKDAALAALGGSRKRVVLDMSTVEFVDSSGLGSMVSLLKATARDGGEMIVCDVRPSVMGLLKLTRMDKVFTIVANRSSAMQKFAS